MFGKPKKFEKYHLKSLLTEFNTPGRARFYSKELPGERRRGLKRDVFDFLSLMTKWGEIVGEKLVDHTFPLKNKNKILYILTDHPAYAEQLSFMGEVLKQKIFSVFPSLRSEIKELKFEQCERKVFEELRPKIIEEQSSEDKLAITTLHPQSPLYKKSMLEAEELFVLIKDEELKKMLTSIYLQNIQIKAQDDSTL